jgi:hypothetical protein
LRVGSARRKREDREYREPCVNDIPYCFHVFSFRGVNKPLLTLTLRKEGQEACVERPKRT